MAWITLTLKSLCFDPPEISLSRTRIRFSGPFNGNSHNVDRDDGRRNGQVAMLERESGPSAQAAGSSRASMTARSLGRCRA